MLHRRRMWSPPHGGVDRNIPKHGVHFRLGASPPHGGVDRNSTNRKLKGRSSPVAPTRGRGSKQPEEMAKVKAFCRPHTGAWIETGSAWPGSRTATGRPHTGAWIETLTQCNCQRVDRGGRPPHGGVDRNYVTKRPRSDAGGRPPHGGVDRNIRKDGTLELGRESPPTRGRGSKPCPAQ